MSSIFSYAYTLVGVNNAILKLKLILLLVITITYIYHTLATPKSIIYVKMTHYIPAFDQ